MGGKEAHLKKKKSYFPQDIKAILSIVTTSGQSSPAVTNWYTDPSSHEKF